MCINRTISCRLCLSENISEPYYFLLENEIMTDKYSKLLSLQTSLFDASIFPNYMCYECQTLLGMYKKF